MTTTSGSILEQASDEERQANTARAIVETIGRLHGFAFDPLKEGGSVPKG